ncbi:protein-export chaperone SecB [Aestuariispira insulae]|uniref:Protein-export protein SecB n=1 Tax=Aestuariispira insulae TaxID=1461337 RepID=A0A3D9HPY6_9PROT|nr:protein-export chaperone SecB [Aestuariispira insulae]RED51371.1 protein translocase subunit secB [Aestuariispira insulae]
MAESENTNVEAGGEAGEQKVPFNILLQYLKDLSFENPQAPIVFTRERKTPQLDVKVDVTVQQLSDTDFEVNLHLNGEAKEDDDAIYLVEMVYGGVVRINDVPQEVLQPVLFVEIPRFLFPFARNIFAESVSNGGFPSVMLAPVDFLDLFRRRVAAAQAEAGENSEEEEATA